MSGKLKGISRKKGWSNEKRMDESREVAIGSLSQWVRMWAGSFGGAVWYEYQELGWLGGMFDRITSAAPSAILLVCGKSLKRQEKVEKEQQEVEDGRRAGSGGVKERLSFMLRGGILFTFSKSGTIIFVEIISCLFLLLFLIPSLLLIIS